MSTPKERPILFKGEMVRAILDGSKTQSRRPVKHPLAQAANQILSYKGQTKFDCVLKDDSGGIIQCPYGKPGELLWVRETFCIESSKEVSYDPSHTDGRPIRHHQDDESGAWWEQPHYRATDPAPELDIGTDEPGCRWRPSIFMPRWASRILLEITAVRVEQLNAISEADARAEGIADGGCLNCGESEPCGCADPRPDARDGFAWLWQSINGPSSWHANPWVWVVEFRRVQP